MFKTTFEESLGQPRRDNLVQSYTAGYNSQPPMSVWNSAGNNSDAIPHTVEQDTNSCYSFKTSNSTKEENMSFAGIIFLKDRFIGFADRKSSSGNQLDSARPDIQKLFWNDKFIVALTGDNSFESIQNGKVQRVWIEDWVKENISKFKFPADLFVELWKYIRKHSDTYINNIHIDGGYFPNSPDCPQVVSFDISSHSYSESIKDQEYLFSCYSGINQFVQYFDNDRSRLYTMDENTILKELQKSYSLIQPKMDYCAVGNKWDIHTLFRKNTGSQNIADCSSHLKMESSTVD